MNFPSKKENGSTACEKAWSYIRFQLIAFNGVHLEVWPFRTTLWCWLERRFLIFRYILICILHLCVKTRFEISRKTPFPSHHQMIVYIMNEWQNFKSRLILRYKCIFNKERKHWIKQQRPFQNFPRNRKERNWSIILHQLFIMFLCALEQY